jgi:hypothetical protein
MELYDGQSLAPEVINWLNMRGFTLIGVFNTHLDAHGLAIQSDFLFKSYIRPSLIL